jgi:hypothetical protein
MRISAFACAAAIAANPVSAGAAGLKIDLLPGHPVYHQSEREAGVVMAISITPGHGHPADLQALCEELRVAAGLGSKNGENVPLEVIFVVPYKGMAIEGYYLPADGAPGSEALVRGDGIARATLDGIVARAGISAHILDEPAVEQEISCELRAPAWLLRWEDLRPVGGDGPDPVIESAHRRFMTIHQSVVEHAAAPAAVALQAPGVTRGLAFTAGAPAPGVVPLGSQSER